MKPTCGVSGAGFRVKRASQQLGTQVRMEFFWEIYQSSLRKTRVPSHWLVVAEGLQNCGARGQMRACDFSNYIVRETDQKQLGSLQFGDRIITQSFSDEGGGQTEIRGAYQAPQNTQLV
jgi:hypothetical protein